ncbi:hypothetical protein N658DRAFT_63855 [Parathielavia hyrcaniae]|uniref:Uncharacterized protein n=1 Tax=Parathielavia hyrcaniae TaxID=113614 RepID=A0AAN6Q680_9PEZI|nr:hypothetical protein N658DRAFT_63855 [Parathielavia hyrcaniae]
MPSNDESPLERDMSHLASYSSRRKRSGGAMSHNPSFTPQLGAEGASRGRRADREERGKASCCTPFPPAPSSPTATPRSWELERARLGDVEWGLSAASAAAQTSCPRVVLPTQLRLAPPPPHAPVTLPHLHPTPESPPRWTIFADLSVIPNLDVREGSSFFFFSISRCLRIHPFLLRGQATLTVVVSKRPLHFLRKRDGVVAC